MFEQTFIKRWIYSLLLSMSGIVGSTANAAPAFKLKPPAEYFSNSSSLALLQAALAGDEAKANELVTTGANPNDEGPSDKPNRLRLLHYAIAANSAQAVRILVASGADPEMVAKGFGRAFLFTITLDNVDMLSLLLDLRPVDTLSKDTLETLLFETVSIPRPRCLEVLLKHGAPIDLKDSAGYTILMRSKNAGDFELMEWILRQGASVHIETINGVTPASSVQDTLSRVQPGSKSHQTLLRIKSLMEAEGIVFPVPGPAENRARRSNQK